MGKKKNEKESEYKVASKFNTDFPKHTLAEAIQIGQTLEDKNGGNPLSPTDIAIALGKSPQSSDFRILLSSSIKYGLTSGSYNQPKVSLQELGQNIVQPRSNEERTKSLIQSFLLPELFKKVYDYYKNKKLPDPTFLKTILSRDFNVDKNQVDKFAEIFLTNVEYLGLVKQATTGKWLSQIDDANIETIPKIEESPSIPPVEESTQTPLSNLSKTPPQLNKSAIFVGHGKNKIPLQQLEKILTEYKIPYKVAIEEANVGRPISLKVAEVMNECGAAIIIFTADQEFKDIDGNTIYRPSENAIYELGASGALYGSRIVIFK